MPVHWFHDIIYIRVYDRVYGPLYHRLYGSMFDTVRHACIVYVYIHRYIMDDDTMIGV